MTEPEIDNSEYKKLVGEKSTYEVTVHLEVRRSVQKVYKIEAVSEDEARDLAEEEAWEEYEFDDEVLDENIEDVEIYEIELDE